MPATWLQSDGSQARKAAAEELLKSAPNDVRGNLEADRGFQQAVYRAVASAQRNRETKIAIEVNAPAPPPRLLAE